MEEEIAKIIFRIHGHKRELVEYADAKSLVSRTVNGLNVPGIAEMVMKMAQAKEPPAFLTEP